MKLCKIVLLSAFAFLATTGNAAEETRTPTNVFRGETQNGMLTCQIAERTAVVKIKLGQVNGFSTVSDCIKSAKADVKRAYPSAVNAVSKNPEAVKLLKDYYAAWLTAVNGTMPSLPERSSDYTLRQTAAQEKYDAIWNRFEVEAGLQ